MIPLDVHKLVRDNEDFRREVVTGEHTQVVLMTIPPGGEIGEEVHEGIDQVLLFVEGEAEATVGDEMSRVGPNQIVVVSAGTRHNFVNVGGEPLRLVTFYSPPEHEPGTVHATKAEADAAEHAH